MTLAEIMKACEVENETLRTEPETTRRETRFALSNQQLTEHLQVTFDLIKNLVLHVKQLKLDLSSREMCGGAN